MVASFHELEATMKSAFSIAVAVVAACLLSACGGGGGGDSGGGGLALVPNAIVSVASNGDQANLGSHTTLKGNHFAALSADGRYVMFVSTATNLDPNCANGFPHIYVRDRQTRSTVCVSVNSNGDGENLNSDASGMSADGRYVVFDSASTNLVGSDINNTLDVFVHDRDADNDGIFDEPGAIRTVLVSEVFGSQLPGPSFDPSISANGRYVAFTSVVSKDAHNRYIETDIFVHDRDFDGNGIYDEPGAGKTRTVRVSVSDSGAPGNALSRAPSISADGRVVAFHSTSTNLIDGLGGLDQPDTWDIFVHDRDADGNGVFDEAGGISTTLVTHLYAEPIIPVGQGDPPCLSADGRYVAFTSTFDFVGGDVNGKQDVFVYDRRDGTNTLVSVNSAGGQSNGASYWCSLSADGRYVTFSSDATNLVAGDTNGLEDVFVHDRLTGQTRRVTDNSLATIPRSAIFGTSAPELSGDGRYVAFQSMSPDLVAGDTNGNMDVFEFQRP
jgi:Tol biopolymer transport system component